MPARSASPFLQLLTVICHVVATLRGRLAKPDAENDHFIATHARPSPSPFLATPYIDSTMTKEKKELASSGSGNKSERGRRTPRPDRISAALGQKRNQDNKPPTDTPSLPLCPLPNRLGRSLPSCHRNPRRTLRPTNTSLTMPNYMGA